MSDKLGELKAKGLPTVDRNGALSRLDGDEDLYKEIVGIYLEDAPQQITAIKDALERSDQVVAERGAHSLKSASANIGGEIMRQIALEMEMAGKKGDLEAVRKLLPALDAAFAELQAAIK